MSNYDELESVINLKKLAEAKETKKMICEDHGEYEANYMFRDVWTMCPECMDIRDAEIEKNEREMEEERSFIRIKKSFDYANIPERFKNCTFDNYKTDNQGQEKALAISHDYYNNFEEIQKTGSSLFYCGSYGTGKTHLAIAILIKLIKNETCSGKYSTTMRMIRDIRSSYGNNDFNEQDIIDRYVNTGLLVLDEVGVQMGTEAEKLLIYEVVNGRYENYKPTILISNLSFNEMTEYLGARSIDRLKSKSGSMIVMDWESWRAK